MQIVNGGHGYQQHSEKMDFQPADNRCPLATSDGGVEDELGQRPYRCHVCRVGFKLKVIIAIIAPSMNAFSDSACCGRCYRSVVFPSVCSSVKLVHPAKAVGRNKMPFDIYGIK